MYKIISKGTNSYCSNSIATPLIVGFILGPNGVAGLLAGATICGFVLAVMMSNSGGAWDNAKKTYLKQEIMVVKVQNVIKELLLVIQ